MQAGLIQPQPEEGAQGQPLPAQPAQPAPNQGGGIDLQGIIQQFGPVIQKLFSGGGQQQQQGPPMPPKPPLM